MSFSETHQHSTKSTQHEKTPTHPEKAKLPCAAMADFLRSLPKAPGWRTPFLYKFQNFWCQPKEIQAIINFQTHFQSKPTDVIIATIPKSGTTWLKALLYATLNRTRIDIGSKSHPMLSSNPHDLVPFLEYKLYANGQLPDLSVLDSPRIFATHVPYHALPDSVKTMTSCDKTVNAAAFQANVVNHALPDSVQTTAFEAKAVNHALSDSVKTTASSDKIVNTTAFDAEVVNHGLPDSAKNSACGPKIVYLCRNPLHTFISTWNFIKNARHDSLGSFTMDEAFDMFCNGVVGFGPFWDHMLGYWNESIADPNRVMFLKYEDMKKGVVSVIKTLSEFFGTGRCSEAEAAEIARLCSFENLKVLEVNKSGMSIEGFENFSLFRKGEVGDWVNHLSPEMAERMRRVVAEKLGGSRLSFFFF